MNTGQMLLTTGAIVLLGLTVITVNSTFGMHGQILTQTQIGLYAISLASSFIQEASGQNFDEVTTTGAVTNPTSLTVSGSLGPDASEVYLGTNATSFDDFDDYNNLLYARSYSGVDSFRVRCSVSFVNETTPDVNTSTQTWFKRIDVRIASGAMTDTIKMSYLFSYYNF